MTNIHELISNLSSVLDKQAYDLENAQEEVKRLKKLVDQLETDLLMAHDKIQELNADITHTKTVMAARVVAAAAGIVEKLADKVLRETKGMAAEQLEDTDRKKSSVEVPALDAGEPPVPFAHTATKQERKRLKELNSILRNEPIPEFLTRPIAGPLPDSHGPPTLFKLLKSRM